MAREISPVCNFIFGSIHTSLLIDMVDVDLTWLRAFILIERTIPQGPESLLCGTKV